MPFHNSVIVLEPRGFQYSFIRKYQTVTPYHAGYFSTEDSTSKCRSPKNAAREGLENTEI